MRRVMCRVAAVAAVALGTVLGAAPSAEQRWKPKSIRGRSGPTDIVVTVTDRLAGAIHSVTWGGKEFIDSTDHGRQLQSASFLSDTGLKDFDPEQFNPTEAGSARDGVGPRSTSRLQFIEVKRNELKTVVRPAFWLAPGDRTQAGKPAKNRTPLSDHLIAKHVIVGYKHFAAAIDYRVAFTLPATEKHTLAQFEAVTGYMPAEFSKFWTLDVTTNDLKPLSDGPGEQALPVIVSTANGSHAMGVWSPEPPSEGFETQRYGRFRFPTAKVVKWNCVFRVLDPNGVKPGTYAYRMFVAVGTLQNVRDTLVGLSADFAKK